MDDCLAFPGDATADPRPQGGKGAALMDLASAGLPVPPGWVLTTAFTEPLLAQLRGTPHHQALQDSAAWPEHCAALQALARTLPFSPAQQRTLEALRAQLPDTVAVRSSSPQEDLSQASFAGGYETVLGVRAEGLEDAVRSCIASALDARVLQYKQAHGFDPLTLSIAVVVQHQLHATVAGVGFSIDPLDNDYDHVALDASWGLGEAVVSGQVTPDHFVLDKSTGAVLHQRLGDKQVRIDVAPEGGVRERAPGDPAGACLDAEQLDALAALVRRVETHQGHPVDIEWAFDTDGLHLLQARPITTWVPLPESMITAPGEPRRLYMDIGLSGGLTLNAPLTPIGESWFAHFASALVDTFAGPLPVTFGPGDELWMLRGARMYQDLSNIFWLSSPGMLAMSQRAMDPLVADTLAAVDRKRYRARRRPSWVSPKLIVPYLRAVWRVRGMLGTLLGALLGPRRAAARLQEQVTGFRDELRAVPDEVDLFALIDDKTARVIRHVIGDTMPALAVGMLGSSLLSKLVPRRHAALLEPLSRGYAGNVVVEMGLALAHLATLLPPQLHDDPQGVLEGLERGALPDDFVLAWQDFLHDYGWRGPHEVDLGQPRYADAPLLALKQVCAMAGGDFDPRAAQAEAVAENRAAFAELERALGPLRRPLARWAYALATHFAGTRDHPKHQYLLFFQLVRRRVVDRGRQLVRAGRLDAPEHALDLTLEDLEAEATVDLRARRAAHLAFVEELRHAVRGFPTLIDSRGRILRPPPRELAPGELRGQPISPGIVRGPVKVLLDPDDKPVEPGDILVAHTTDPGWTPLFVNAAAVLLEVGGLLQHGAVVAREYGKPCVAGIPDILGSFTDGEWVEVDGAAGTVRRIERG